jgi:hypothetical protein
VAVPRTQRAGERVVHRAVVLDPPDQRDVLTPAPAVDLVEHAHEQIRRHRLDLALGSHRLDQARALHSLARVYGDGTLREARDWMRHEGTIDATTPEGQQLGLLWDALVAAADCSPDAEDLIAAAAARAEELHAAGKVSHATMPLLVEAYAMNRDVDGAIVYEQRVNDLFRVDGAIANASTYILQQTLLMLEQGDSAQVVTPLVDEGVRYTSPYDALSIALGAACRAILCLRAGDRTGATRLAEESLRKVDQTHQVWQRADLRRALSEVPRTTGDVELERRLLREATEMYARKEIRSYDAEITARLAELGVERV